jgi:hypothetical protein
MNSVKFAQQCLKQIFMRLDVTLKDLNPEDIIWRPAPHANCIAEIILHVARGEDQLISRATGDPQLWVSQQWYKRFGYPSDIPIAVEFDIFRNPESPPLQWEILLDYLQTLHQNTLEKLRNLTPEDLDLIPDPDRPQMPAAAYFRHLITHTNNHQGQVDYIRGLLHPDWSLTPGTGMVQT